MFRGGILVLAPKLQPGYLPPGSWSFRDCIPKLGAWEQEKNTLIREPIAPGFPKLGLHGAVMLGNPAKIMAVRRGYPVSDMPDLVDLVITHLRRLR